MGSDAVRFHSLEARGRVASTATVDQSCFAWAGLAKPYSDDRLHLEDPVRAPGTDPGWVPDVCKVKRPVRRERSSHVGTDGSSP